MSRGVYEIRRARKARPCGEDCCLTIQAGDLYLYGACPPEHDANSGKGWWIITACLDCAEHYALHTTETRAQLATRAAAPAPEGRADG